MVVKILFDNSAVSGNFFTGWGFSALVGDDVLFDTGEKSKYLLGNMNLLNVDAGSVKHIVLSHQHWDHIGGIGVFKGNGAKKVYICEEFEKEFIDELSGLGLNVVSAAGYFEIKCGVFLSREFDAVYKGEKICERCLIIKKEGRLVVLTGCSHPGIVIMVNDIIRHFEVDGIDTLIGGFHLKGKPSEDVENIVKKLKLSGVKRVAPLHCCGNVAKAVFKREYGEKFLNLAVGSEVEL